jgi:MarR family transcriptional regulator, transcriptional regulator for hemolysin
MPEVSDSGELFLRRREVTASGGPGDMNYPFSQGITFVARRWRNLMNEELRAVGQSQARWGTLYWIRVFGDSVNQTVLADRIGVEQPTLGRVLRDLESEGLIERLPGKGDRRAKVIRLTDAAKPVMRDIDRIQNTVRAKLLKGIDADDLSTCMAVFAQILANMDEH